MKYVVMATVFLFTLNAIAAGKQVKKASQPSSDARVFENLTKRDTEQANNKPEATEAQETVVEEKKPKAK